MITKYQAGITIGFTLGVLFSSQMCGDRLRSAVSRSFTENASELGSQKSADSDRAGERLNSDGTMYGVNLRHTRVYDAQGMQEPKSVLWKTPKLFTPDPGLTFADRAILGGGGECKGSRPPRYTLPRGVKYYDNRQ